MDASEYQAIIRLSTPLLVGLLVLVIILRFFSLRMSAARRTDDKLDPETMRSEMESLAARKKAQRKTDLGDTEAGTESETGHQQDGFIEGEPLV